MDSPANLPGAPLQNRHSALFWVFFWVLALAAIVMGVYLLQKSGYISSHQSRGAGIDIGFVTITQGGSTWYEGSSLGGRLTHYPTLAGANITEIVRAGDHLFMLASGASGNSTLYSYQNNHYASLYQGTGRLWDLAVSADGTYVSFDQDTSAPEVTTVDVTSKVQQVVGGGFGSAIVTLNGSRILLYIDKNNILSDMLVSGTWTSPTPVFTSPKNFSSASNIAANNTGNFAFVDPLSGATQVWKLINLNPTAGSPATLYKASHSDTQTPSSVSRLEYSSNGDLWLFTSNPTTNTYGFTDFTTPLHTFNVKIPASDGNSLRVIFISL